MIRLPTILLLSVIIPPSESTFAGLYMIGRDGLNNTLNSALEIPKRFLRGYGTNDPDSRAVIAAVLRAIEVVQTVMNVALKVVLTPFDIIIEPVDIVVEGIRECTALWPFSSKAAFSEKFCIKAFFAVVNRSLNSSEFNSGCETRSSTFG